MALNGGLFAQRERTTLPLPTVPPRRLLIASLLLLAPAAAQAHAILEESDPPQDGSIPAGTVVLQVRFNSRIDHARSRLMLTRPDKSQTALPIRQAGPPDIVVATADLTPGAYVVRWNVLATDGHLTRGDVRFTVTEH